MKKILLTLGLLFIFTTNLFAFDKIRIAIGEWPPFYSEKFSDFGRDPLIIKEAFSRVGVDVEYGFFPWSKSYNLVLLGKWNATGLWSKNLEREKEFLFTDPVIIYEMYFFHKKSLNFKWEKIDDLKQYKVAASKNFLYGKEFDSAVKQGKINVDRVYSEIDCLRALLNDRADIVPMEINVGYYLIKKDLSQDALSKLTNHPKLLDKAKHYLLFSKKISDNIRLVSLFNKGLRAIKEDGTLDSIIEKYLKIYKNKKAG